MNLNYLWCRSKNIQVQTSSNKIYLWQQLIWLKPLCKDMITSNELRTVIIYNTFFVNSLLFDSGNVRNWPKSVHKFKLHKDTKVSLVMSWIVRNNTVLMYSMAFLELVFHIFWCSSLWQINFLIMLFYGRSSNAKKSEKDMDILKLKEIWTT